MYNTLRIRNFSDTRLNDVNSTPLESSRVIQQLYSSTKIQTKSLSPSKKCLKTTARVFDEIPGLAGRILCMTCSNFQLQATTYGAPYLPAPTSETKKFLNGICRVYGKLHLSCSEFFRAATGSTRKQLRTYAQKLFDEMRLDHGKNCMCCLAF